MIEEDTAFMRRAIKLARKGAGLVSPNPMVGALLVKDGRVIGEGYHRYDKLKHAESYAIEMAGEGARGATLYCSLEPCCHYGRTPPCTDALIEAGIGRAVVAVVDPNPKVSGRGLDQLRSAGIEVEVGLCEDESLYLNEFYFKYITRETPFVHAVTECAPCDTGSQGEWTPSSRFLESALDYDSIILGASAGPNRMIARALLKRERHRPLIVAGSHSALEDIFATSASDHEMISLILGLTAPATAGLAGEAVLPIPERATTVKPDLNSVLKALAELRATSVMALPGALNIQITDDLDQVDKLTLVARGAESGSASDRACGELRRGLKHVEVWRADVYTEYTGYLRQGDTA